MSIYNDDIYHFGIMGMKWGKTKTFENSPKMLKKDAINTIKFQNKDIKKASRQSYSRSDRQEQRKAYKDVMTGKVIRKQNGKTWNFNNEDINKINKARIEYGKRQTVKTMISIGLTAVSIASTLAGTTYLADMNMIRR